MWLQSLIYLPSIIAISTIAMFTIIKSKNKSLLYFSLFAFTISLWLLTQYFAQLNINNSALFFIQLTVFFTNFLVYFFLLFIVNFQTFTSSIKNSKIAAIALVLPLVFSVFSFSSLMVTGIVVTDTGFAVESVGSLYFVQLAFLAIYLLVSLTILIVDTIKKQKKRRTQNYLLLFAFSQAAIVSVGVNAFFSTVPITQIFVIISLAIMVTLIAYTIVRHRLFDIRLVAVRALTYLLSVGLLATIYSVITFRLVNVFTTSWSLQQKEILYITLAVLLALTFAPLKRFFERVTNSIFYRNHYDAQEFINSIGKITASEIELAKLTHDVRAEISKQMKVARVEIIVLSPADVYYQNKAFKSGSIAISRQQLTALGNSLVTSEDNLHGSSAKIMKQFDINVSLALKSQGKTIGYLLLGDKKSGDVYSTQDLRVLTTIGSELSVAVQNALSYKEIQLFSETLAQKVRERTKQLNDANHQLKILDEAKDEFISMASHQLRTPLTTVKGYASMLQEGDFGHLSAKQKEPVKQALDGANRMARLIDDLLNVSRMDANRFYLEVSEVDVKALVREEINQLLSLAKAKGVVITYHELSGSIHKIRIDENKTRQVIMNLVDNAIHYSQAAEGGGKIHISLSKNPHEIIFIVQDNGIGVPKAMQHRLFTKMFRADNAREVRPDGTGLGLYLVKRVVQDQGGKIIFESKPGGGSTFGFTLPFSGVPKSVEAKSKQIGARVASSKK